MLLSASGRVVKTIPTAAREVYDVSGAGDTALAALVLALACGAGLEESAHFANAAAGVVVAKLGTATVGPDELLARVSHAS
jgi:D-beta-D-heptose 7-phosphate kinase/D-beta-D-heptose 1-phosphate adenosyltransferase